MGNAVSVLTAPPRCCARYVITETARESTTSGVFSQTSAAGRGWPPASARAGNDQRPNGQKSNKRSTQGNVTVIGLAMRPQQNVSRTSRYRLEETRSVDRPTAHRRGKQKKAPSTCFLSA